MESNICEQTEDELEEQKVNQADQIAYSDMPYDPVEAQQEIMVSVQTQNFSPTCLDRDLTVLLTTTSAANNLF